MEKSKIKKQQKLILKTKITKKDNCNNNLPGINNSFQVFRNIINCHENLVKSGFFKD